MASFAARAVKHGLALLVDRSGAMELLRSGQRARGPRVHVFGYHRVVPDPAVYAGRTVGPLCVSIASFESHLDHLAKRYALWPLDPALEVLCGARTPPEDGRDVAVLTFDDGYIEVLEYAAPILAARGVPATVYVTSGITGTGRPQPHDRIFALMLRVREQRVRLLGSAVPDRLLWPMARADYALQSGDPVEAADALLGALPIADLELVAEALAARVGEPGSDEVGALLDWSGIARLLDSGFTVGAHGVSHTHLPLEDDERLVAELTTSRAEIARRLGTTPTTFSYPAGRYDGRVLRAVRSAGYRGAITTEDRKNPIATDPFRVGRKMMHEDHGIGVGGRLAPSLAAAQLDGLFTALGLAHAVPGDRGLDTPWL